MPAVEIDRRLAAELAEKAAEENRRRRLDPSEVGTWVEVGPPSTSRDFSPPRRARHDSDNEDLSPPRRRMNDDLSPPRRTRHDSDNDLSPPRRKPTEDLSPPRRTTRHDSDNDLSPPRRRPTASNDLSPPRRTRHDSDNDLSPPRRRPSAEADLSPPRRARHDSDNDLSPPRRKRSKSPPSSSYQRNEIDGDLSPPRKRQKRHDSPSPPRSSVAPSTPVPAPIGGLVMARDVVAEAQARKKREMESLKGRDDESMGKHAATVYRDRHGRKLGSYHNSDTHAAKKFTRQKSHRNLAALRIEMLNQMMRQQQGILVDPEEEQMEWGKGKVDRAAENRAQQRKAEESGAPYRPYSAEHDETVVQQQLERDRWGDPMAHLARKKSSEPAVKKRPEWNKPYPPNRFNIKPGHLWDGVDRSNGFEKTYFERQNTLQAKKVEAYHYSAGDM